jgi:F-box/leucine-rich repeat protein 10/11
MARELRWRVRAAAGVDSGDELEDETGAAVKSEANNGAMEVEPATPVGSILGKKRTRQDAKPIFRNWQPPEWEKVETVPTRETQADFNVEEDAEGWMKREGLAGQVKRTVRVNELSKIRRLGNGAIERYRVVRTVEYVVPGNMV